MTVVIGASTKGLETGMKNAAKAVAVFGAAVAASAAVTINAASNFQENLNLLAVSFGKQTEEVLKWADTFGSEVGRSSATMLEFAGSLQAMLGPMVGSRKEAAAMSISLAELAVDLSSFFNISESDALLKLRAGLVGSQEPLRTLGVVMTVAALDAFALSKGINKSTLEMTEAEKVALRYEFIMAKTTIAQGDAKATADGFANQIRELKESLKATQIVIGSALLPAVSELLNIFKEFREETAVTDLTIRSLAAGAFSVLVSGFEVILEVVNFARVGWLEFDSTVQQINANITSSMADLFDMLGKLPGEIGDRHKQTAKDLRKAAQSYNTDAVELKQKIDDIVESTGKMQQKIARVQGALELAAAGGISYADALEIARSRSDDFGDTVTRLGGGITTKLSAAFKELNEQIPTAVEGFFSIGVSMDQAAESAKIFEDAEKAKVLALKESTDATDAAAASMQAYAEIAGAVSSAVITAATNSASTQKEKIREVIRALAAAAAALAAKGIIQWGGGNPVSVALAPAAGAAAFALVNAFASSFHTGGIVGPQDGLQLPGMAPDERLVTALVGEEFIPPGQSGGGTNITFTSFLPMTESEARRVMERTVVKTMKKLIANGYV